MDNKIFIIAEAGDNHNGNIDFAFKLIDKAKESGADAVKFQTFITDNIITKDAKMAEYQIQNIGQEKTQYEMVKELELSFMDFKKLKKYCDKVNIKFLTTAFDIDSLNFITDKLKVDMLKIPSGEITNYPYLVACARKRLPIILSTGMSFLKEVGECVKLLKKNGAGEISILHCTTEYPAPKNQVNLNAMLTLKKKFRCKVGYSDHTKGIDIPIAAVALGARIIEKHFTLDKNLPGPDHKASLEPEELKVMVESIREVSSALGDGLKTPAQSEIKNIAVARKSIVARKDIKVGEKFSENNITTKRPGTGINPMRWQKVLRLAAKRDFKKDELIEL